MNAFDLNQFINEIKHLSKLEQSFEIWKLRIVWEMDFDIINNLRYNCGLGSIEMTREEYLKGIDKTIKEIELGVQLTTLLQ